MSAPPGCRPPCCRPPHCSPGGGWLPPLAGAFCPKQIACVAAGVSSSPLLLLFVGNHLAYACSLFFPTALLVLFVGLLVYTLLGSDRCGSTSPHPTRLPEWSCPSEWHCRMGPEPPAHRCQISSQILSVDMWWARIWGAPFKGGQKTTPNAT